MAKSAEIYGAMRTRSFCPAALSRARLALAGLAIGCAVSPGRAVAYVEYGFHLIDNSAGGSVMDDYVTQEIWADTDMRWFGTQLRLELDEGSIFQGELDGSGFMTEQHHDALATLDPALEFDTRVGVNGAAPSIVLGHAANLGGVPPIRTPDQSSAAIFTDTHLNIAYAPGGGEVFSGGFNFGTITLSTDAVGNGAFMYSFKDEDGFGHYAQTFEVDGGVMRLTGEQVDLLDPDYSYTLENFEFIRQERSRPRLPDEEPQHEPAPVAEDPPVIDLPSDDPIQSDPEMPNESHTPVDERNDATSGSDDRDRGILIDFELGEAVPINAGLSDDDELLIDLDWGIFDPGTVDLVTFETAGLTIASANAADGAVELFQGVLRSLDGTAAELYATTGGELVVPLSTLSEEKVAALVASGSWAARGDNLVFQGFAGVPEPGSAVLAVLVAAAMAFYGRRRRGG